MHWQARKVLIERLLTDWMNGDVLKTPAEIAEQVWDIANEANHPTHDDIVLVRPILKGDKHFKELAEEFGVTAPGVRKRVHNALKRLNPEKYEEGCHRTRRYWVAGSAYEEEVFSEPPIVWLRKNAGHFLPNLL